MWSLLVISSSLAPGGAPLFPGIPFSPAPPAGSDPQTKRYTLAAYYRDNYDQFTDPEEKYQALLYCLTNVAHIIDSDATQAEVQYKIGDSLHRVLDRVDQQEKQMNEKFKILEEETGSMRGQVDELVNQTRIELVQMTKNVRKEIIAKLGEMAQQKIATQHAVSSNVNVRASQKIKSLKTVSTAQAVGLFAGLQVLVILCLYLSCKVVKASIYR
jgi:DNA anti-recombination protein RmuC